MKKLVVGLAVTACAAIAGTSAVMYRCGVSRNLYLIPKLMKRSQKNSPSQQQDRAVRPALDAGIEWFEQQTVEEKRIGSFDGLSLYARYFPAQGSKNTVILCHGYRGSGLGDFGGIVRYLHEELKLNILMIDERSHGKSEGKHMTYGIKERFDICRWAKLIAREHPEHSIFLYGMSMGAASVLMTPSTDLPKNVRGLIADCGFTSPDDIFRSVAKDWFKLPPFPFVDIAELYAKVFAHFDFSQCSAKQALRECRLPVLFFHGTADDFVPPYMSEENYEACAGEKELVKIEGAFHATSCYIDFEKYTNALKAFIERASGDKT